MPDNSYVVNNGGVIIATAITILQIKAGADKSLEIVALSLTQSLSEISTQERVQLLRKTAAATVTAVTPLKIDTDSPAASSVGSTSGTGKTGTAEGTDGDLLMDEGFNNLNGFSKIWIPEARPVVRASEIIALKFPVAPGSATWVANIEYREF